MKKFWLLTFLMTSGLSFSQSNEYRGFMEELYVARQPSPRAEAMGRGLAADNQNNFASYYNPALTSNGEGLKINTSFSKRYYHADKAYWNYFGATYKLKNVGSFGISNYHYNYGYDLAITTPANPKGDGNTYQIYYDMTSLNFSREIVKDFSAGINITAINHHNETTLITADKNIAYTIDLGVLKKFTLPSFSDANLSHSVNIGSSLYNITGAKFVFTSDPFGTGPSSGDVNLPVIFRGAVGYNLNMKGKVFGRSSNMFSVITNFEYEKILNTAKYDTYKAGAEFNFHDLISLRAGYFSRVANLTHTVYSGNIGTYSQFTYGAGIKIPVDLIFNISSPVSLSVDYVNLKIPYRDVNSVNTSLPYDHGRYNTFSASLNLIPGW
jgi:hypothetical protein